MRIATYSRTYSILKDNKIFAKKNYGQNFIIEFSIIDNIVELAGVDNDTGVIEIGPGIGALTEGLALKAKKVVAYEIDKKLIEVLEDNLKEFSNIEIICKDFLKINIEEDIEKYFKNYTKIVVVSNLPYYITAPILIKIFEEGKKIKSVTAMMQKEVAKRICAKRGGKEYNNLSILTSYYSDSSIVLNVSKNIFIPRPNVDSCVVKFDLTKKDYKIENEKHFLQLLRDSFNMRRKKLINNLEKYDKRNVEEVLKELNINTSVRAEDLELKDFIYISNKLITNK